MLEGLKIRRHYELRQLAVLGAWILNCHRDPKRRPTPIKPDDLIAPLDFAAYGKKKKRPPIVKDPELFAELNREADERQRIGRENGGT